MSSAGVLRKMKHKLRAARLGHGGTLDPMATGLLVVACGKATKLLRFSMGANKAYDAKIMLGQSTDTEDALGEVTARAAWEHVSKERLIEALNAFRGEILQTPPRYSALHVDGRRAYELARSGKEFELAARKIHVMSLELLDFAAPEFSLRIHCSGGTYIRSLARDLGLALNSLAHLTALRRIKSGHFELGNAVSLAEFLDSDPANFLITPYDAMSPYPAIRLSPDDLRRLQNGLEFTLPKLESGLYRLCAANEERLAAMLSINEEQKRDIIRFNP